MNPTVFLTVLSGVMTYILGQLVLKLVIEPVQDLRKSIGVISHSLIEHANVIHNPGVPTKDAMNETSQHLRQLSSQLQSHLYLVPFYSKTAWVFRLPSRDEVMAASNALIGLSNSVFQARPNIYEINAKRVETVCDSLGIYLAEGNRLPKETE